MTDLQVQRLRRLDVCAVSDALDKLQLTGVVTGLPQRSSAPGGASRIAGRAVTMKVGPGTPPPGPPPTLRARAELGSVLAARLGARLPASDLAELLQLSGAPERPGLDHLSAAFRRAGYSVAIDNDPDPKDLPALAEMTSGQIVLLLSRQDDSLTLFDPTTPDRSTDVPLAEFTPVFTGWLLRVRVPFAQIESRHAEPQAAPHWFWSEFRHHRRPAQRLVGRVPVCGLVRHLRHLPPPV